MGYIVPAPPVSLHIRATSELLDDAMTGVGKFCMSVAEVMRLQVESFLLGDYLRSDYEMPSAICGRPIEVVDDYEKFRCAYCGHEQYINLFVHTCEQCPAPTPAWWWNLDRMIFKWKRGG